MSNTNEYPNFINTKDQQEEWDTFDENKKARYIKEAELIKKEDPDQYLSLYIVRMSIEY